VVTKSYLRGIDDGDRTIAHPWPEVTRSHVTGSDVTFPHTFFFSYFFSRISPLYSPRSFF
jgi:hypothetical protein